MLGGVGLGQLDGDGNENTVAASALVFAWSRAGTATCKASGSREMHPSAAGGAPFRGIPVSGSMTRAGVRVLGYRRGRGSRQWAFGFRKSRQRDDGCVPVPVSLGCSGRFLAAAAETSSVHTATLCCSGSVLAVK